MARRKDPEAIDYSRMRNSLQAAGYSPDLWSGEDLQRLYHRLGSTEKVIEFIVRTAQNYEPGKL